MPKVKIKINGRKIECEKGRSVLEVATENGIFIPALCHHPDFKPKGNCRMCLVEVKGKKGLSSSCSLFAEEGLDVNTDSEEIRISRVLNLRLLFGEHMKSCDSCMKKFDCPLLEIEKTSGSKNNFEERKDKRKIYKIANAIEFDGEKCIDCRNCVDACSYLQKINYIQIKGKNKEQEICPTDDKDINCILCGQCTAHCPVSSAREQTHWEEVEKAINNPKKIVVAQFAPSIRVSVGEEFGMEPGSVVSEQVVTSLKKLGFDYVFDVSFGADLTTLVESDELIERIKSKTGMPMITSCCPSWVLYCEFYHPELIPNLTTSRSPQIHLGGVLKSYWANKMNINPKDIVVVSIMPCTSKKFEASRKELKTKAGLNPVDYVLTVRELAFMIKKNKMDLSRMKKTLPDSPAGESGAGVIYGESGGVMESALRAADFALSGKKNPSFKVNFNKIRNLDGVKEAVVNVAGKKIRIAVVNGIGNVEPVIKNLKNYDYIEVMACPGGCIGGGGQPIPTNKEIREKRIAALAEIYKNSEIRKAYEDKPAIEILSWIKDNKKDEELLFTNFKARKDYS